jgi:hypothetical protein
MIRPTILAIAALITPYLSTVPAHAAMGLRCSDWLNARAHIRYDARTKKAVPVTPVGAPPVSKKTDDKAAFVNAYAGGIVETFMWLDLWIAKLNEGPGVQLPAKLDLPNTLDRVDQLCRGGLEQESRDYDVLDVVTMNNQGNVMLRVQVIQTLLEKYMEAGRREGQRSR